ncbi:MAG: DUF3473 domain-containing protein [Planctomycetota bacterium]|nr:MAG: DUF3473 domain-containing protein [Planctomycetota bacterium]
MSPETLEGAISVDVEEYFHVENLREAAPPHTWDELPSRVEHATHRVLDLFDEAGVRGTFFTLGWVAERHPALVREIVARGHELASHGHGHRMLTELDPDRLREDLGRARAALEDAGGVAVRGYRAPTWSIVPATDWAFDVLVEAGYRYDASVFPVRHDRYGDPRAPIVPHWRVREGGRLLELPPLVGRFAGRNWPAAGGGYLRLLPLGYMRWAVRQARAAARPAVLYLHPWELDPDQPRLAVSRLRRLRHYRGLERFADRLRTVLGWLRLGRMDSLADAWQDRARPWPA